MEAREDMHKNERARRKKRFIKNGILRRHYYQVAWEAEISCISVPFLKAQSS
jgi:hypothetical protein